MKELLQLLITADEWLYNGNRENAHYYIDKAITLLKKIIGEKS